MNKAISIITVGIVGIAASTHSPTLQQRVTTLERQVAALERRVETLEKGQQSGQEKATSTEAMTYELLRGPWRPYEQETGLGLEILIPTSATKQQIIRLLKELGTGKDPVNITVWTDRQAYENANRDVYGDLYDRHLICVYTKNTKVRRALYRCNEIRWMQEVGKFSHLLGQKTEIR